jgi:DNA-binding MarR family transcriptional regulator
VLNIYRRQHKLSQPHFVANVLAAVTHKAPKSNTNIANARSASKVRAPLDPGAVAQEVVVRAMRLGEALGSRMDLFFRDYGITKLQFNVLRILYVRDPERDGLPSGSFASRLVHRAPDVPRVIDRLVGAGLLERVRSDEDRRVVRVRLTDEGAQLVERIDGPLLANDCRLVSGLGDAELRKLTGLLERALQSVLENGAAEDGDVEQRDPAD